MCRTSREKSRTLWWWMKSTTCLFWQLTARAKWARSVHRQHKIVILLHSSTHFSSSLFYSIKRFSLSYVSTIYCEISLLFVYCQNDVLLCVHTVCLILGLKLVDAVGVNIMFSLAVLCLFCWVSRAGTQRLDFVSARPLCSSHGTSLWGSFSSTSPAHWHSWSTYYKYCAHA